MIEIQPQLLTLSGLFSKRLFQVPQYQRSYSWYPEQRKNLFDDILNTWRAGNDRQHYMATVVGLRRTRQIIGTDDYQVIDIVDGQQRITTLIVLLKAMEIALGVGAEEAKAKRDIHETLVKSDDASLLLLQTNHDTSHYFADYLRKGNHQNPSVAVTIADREILLAMEECEKFVEECKAVGLPVVQLATLLKNRITFVFHEISDEALVYTVFEVLNSRGLPVSWFDRLKSMLMAIVFEADNKNPSITREIHSLWSDIYRVVGLRIGMNTQSLRFAACLKDREEPSKLPREKDAAETLEALGKGGVAKVIEVTKWLKAVNEATDSVLGNRRARGVTRIIQARLVAVAVHLRSDLSDAERAMVLRRWENVAFRIYGMFRRDARYATGDFIRLAWKITNESLSPNRIMAELSRIGAAYPIEKAANELRNRDCYKEWQDNLRYFLTRYEEYLAKEAGQNFNNEQWQRIWTANASDSIEHILPEASDASGVHRLGNLLLLPPNLNSKLQDLRPAKKTEEYRKTGLLIARKVADQIDSARWGAGQIKIRENELLEWAKTEWAD